MNPTSNKPALQQQNGHRSPSTSARTVPGSKRQKRRGYIPALDTRPPIKRVLPKLERVTQTSPGQYLVICPAHRDTDPSLSIKEDSSGKVLLHCHAGCSLEKILKALGLTKADLFPPRTGRRNGHASPSAPAAKNGEINRQRPRKKPPVSAKKASKRRSDPRPRTKGERRAREFAAALTEKNCQRLADELDLPPEALRALGIGWRKTDKGGVYTFPEHDGDGRVIGINVRALTGKKWMIPRSKRGLNLPTGWRERKGPIYIAEGASCTADGLERLARHMLDNDDQFESEYGAHRSHAAGCKHNAEMILRLYNDADLPQQIHEAGLDFVYRLERDVADVTVGMIKNGVGVDLQQLAEVAQKHRRIADKLRRQIQRVAGEKFNPNAAVQIAELLYDELKLPVIATTNRGNPAQDQDTLRRLQAYDTTGVVKLLRRYLTHLLSALPTRSAGAGLADPLPDVWAGSHGGLMAVPA